ncbi:PREDICTED: mitochondrial chaperone BCS1 [Ceratosolen solmsi marchali]|uniref:Mitochondrial chaperone BCS1 n=1 Tax=Ceratosolen solmsi marchali TaxID=326594 RepID=A0AAJ6YJ97_9HYME|nr:PREDICTED: mitochondrial chaperone BCS1 [Ceratosolen solmsi marchali]
MTFIEYVQTLSDNPYFGAGFGLFGLGAGAAVLRKGLQAGLILFRRHYMITLEVPCRDKSYEWLLKWITYKGAKKTQHLAVSTSFEQSDTGYVSTRYEFIPSIGTHFFRYNKNWIKVQRTREQQMHDVNLGMAFESVHLTAFGKDRNIYFQILEEARQMALAEHKGKTIMYVAMGHEWRQFGHPKKLRPLESVILDTGIGEKIVKDCKEFIENVAWYSDRGIPYRRGYLLHGPPGCGKSSFITALAGNLDRGICVLNLSDRLLSDDRLNHLLAIAPQQTIILLEDIDAVFVSREETKEVKAAYQGLNSVTLSGLLNALDGVASSEGRILFMTTNYLDRLDPALIRPGRVDYKEYIGWCSYIQLEQMFLRFYRMHDAETEKLSKKFAECILSYNRNVSPAQIQGFLLFFKNEPKTVVNNVSKIWELM